MAVATSRSLIWSEYNLIVHLGSTEVLAIEIPCCVFTKSTLRKHHRLCFETVSHFAGWAPETRQTSQFVVPEPWTNRRTRCVHSADLDNLDLEFDLELPMLYTVAQYDVSGRILLIPIKGNGPLYGNWSKCSTVLSLLCSFPHGVSPIERRDDRLIAGFINDTDSTELGCIVCSKVERWWKSQRIWKHHPNIRMGNMR